MKINILKSKLRLEPSDEEIDEEIQNPKDSVHKIVLKITIDNIKKLIK